MRRSSNTIGISLYRFLVALPCIVLIALYSAGLLADHHYYFDLLGHFVLQYMMAALFLCIFAALFKQVKWAFVMFALVLVCFGHSRLTLHDPFQFIATPAPLNSLTIASWNQHTHNMNTKNMADLFFAEGSPPDVIIILETNGNTVKMAETMAEGYPHQINGLEKQPDHRPMNLLIMSRFPILEQTLYPLNTVGWNNAVLRFKIHPPSAPKPYIIYALHTNSPSSAHLQRRRNYELERLAYIIKEETSPNIIVAGDINITPYIPAFRDLLLISGLNYQSYGAFLNPSWPVITRYPAFRIPIDHMLYSDSLTQHYKNAITLNGSDHLELIAKFSQK